MNVNSGSKKVRERQSYSSLQKNTAVETFLSLPAETRSARKFTEDNDIPTSTFRNWMTVYLKKRKYEEEMEAKKKEIEEHKRKQH